jgi:RNA polymerase sigma-70 factor, ECF subfamily
MNKLVLTADTQLKSRVIYSAQTQSDPMQDFLTQVERKAFRMAEIAIQNHSDALDVVQDAMIKLVEKYSDKPREEWKPLFYRILQNRIMDYFRHKKLMNNIFFWKKDEANLNSVDRDIIEEADERTPEREIQGQRNLKTVIRALKKLPLRQQQCFMLRSWEGLSVKETADVMGCTEGSVKTHYSRARESLSLVIQEELF